MSSRKLIGSLFTLAIALFCSACWRAFSRASWTRRSRHYHSRSPGPATARAKACPDGTARDEFAMPLVPFVSNEEREIGIDLYRDVTRAPRSCGLGRSDRARRESQFGRTTRICSSLT